MEENVHWNQLNLLGEVSIKILNRIFQYFGVNHGNSAPVLLHALILNVFVPQWRRQKISPNVNQSSFKKPAVPSRVKRRSYMLKDTDTSKQNTQVLWWKKGFTLWMQESAKHCIYLPRKSIPWPKSSNQGLPKPKTGWHLPSSVLHMDALRGRVKIKQYIFYKKFQTREYRAPKKEQFQIKISDSYEERRES